MADDGRYYRPVPKDLNNCFRDTEKFYRKPPTGRAAKQLNSKPTDFTNVIDLCDLKNNTPENRELIIDMKDMIKDKTVNDLNVPQITQFYAIKSIPGFLFIPNPFTPEQQIYWTNRCVKKYTIGNPTNITNLKMVKWRENKKDQYTEEEESEYEKVFSFFSPFFNIY